MSADVRVELHAHDDGTRLTYDADAVVGGMVGGVGQRMLTAVARRMAGEFFGAVDDVLTGRAATEVAGAGTAGGTGGGTGRTGGTGGGTETAGAPRRSLRRPARAASRSDFVAGAAVGAAAALAGVLLGAVLGRRR